MRKMHILLILVLLVFFIAGCDNMAGEASRFKTAKFRLSKTAESDQVTERITCNFIDKNSNPLTESLNCFSDTGHTCSGEGNCAVSVTEDKGKTLVWKSEKCKPVDANGNTVEYLKTTMDGNEETLTFLCEPSGLDCGDVNCEEVDENMKRMEELGMAAEYENLGVLYDECCGNDIGCIDCEYRLAGEFTGNDGETHYRCVEVCKGGTWHKTECSAGCCPGDEEPIPILEIRELEEPEQPYIE